MPAYRTNLMVWSVLLAGSVVILMALNTSKMQRALLVHSIVRHQATRTEVHLYPVGVLTPNQEELLKTFCADGAHPYFFKRIEQLKTGSQDEQRAAAIIAVYLAANIQGEAALHLLDTYLATPGTFNLITATEISLALKMTGDALKPGSMTKERYDLFSSGLNKWMQESEIITEAIEEASEAFNSEKQGGADD